MVILIIFPQAQGVRVHFYHRHLKMDNEMNCRMEKVTEM